MKDISIKERFIEFRAQGLSFDKISEELKTAKQTLINWSKELELEIANLKAIELEALQEQYYLTKTKRIELLGEKLQSIKSELETRDLKDIPTDKLFTLFIKCFELMKEEAVEPVFSKKEPLDIDFLETVNRWKG